MINVPQNVIVYNIQLELSSHPFQLQARRITDELNLIFPLLGPVGRLRNRETTHYVIKGRHYQYLYFWVYLLHLCLQHLYHILVLFLKPIFQCELFHCDMVSTENGTHHHKAIYIHFVVIF